ncbi:MAG TPA: glycosyltransferase family 2 protein [Chitinophagales bacterium]|nr:glycosyltransferase family 2 protein [Chitinophagales bacterium]
MDSTPQYSVVVPVYNSEKTLAELCTRVDATFMQMNTPYEIILVNDHSRDGSWNVIRQLKNKYNEKLTAVHLRGNFGQHKALLCGFQFARGEYIVTIDDDLQFFPEDIELLIKRVHETKSDLVYGTYMDERKHSPVRRWGSNFMGYVFEKFGNTVGQGSSFKIIHRSVIDKIKDYNHSFTFVDEILSWHTTKIEWQQVRHAARREGTSGYSVTKLVFLSLNLIFAYTTIPLRFMTWFGLASFWVCLVLVIYFIYMKITLGSPLGFTALIVSIFMSTGLILFSLGIIGEYLNRLFALQHKKPPYLIQEVLK